MYDNKFDRLLDAIEDSWLLRLAIAAPIIVSFVYGFAVVVSYYFTFS
jgi:hypothetical protein